MRTFFTSDPHFFHTNIITFCGRPFLRDDGQPDQEKMHTTLIERWNSVVTDDDLVYLLGDFSFGPIVDSRAIRQKLRGKIILIRGNHDRSKQQMLQLGFEEVHNRLELKLDDKVVYLSHIPYTVSDPHPRKYKPEFTPPPPAFYHYWLCGHVHERWRRRGKIINVGVDQWDFTPRTFEELIAAEDQSVDTRKAAAPEETAARR